MTGVVVRPVAAADSDAWVTAYRGYRDFYGMPHDPQVFETVWEWLMDPLHETRGLVAEAGGEIVGLANFRSFARPIVGARGLFLDDLFTAPAARGQGVGSALLVRLAEIARDEQAPWCGGSPLATTRLPEAFTTGSHARPPGSPTT